MEQLKKIAKHVKENHFLEWKNSIVSQDIVELNIRYLEGDSVYEYLCYGITREERRNDGRLPEKYLNRYKQAAYGGWYCAGIDLVTLKDSEWGCFKPDKPRKHDGKLVKYEHPSGVNTGLFALKVSDIYWDDAIKNYQFPKKKEDSFWEWVLNNPLPVLITEGAKKAGCLLSLGYIAVALPGVSNGFINSELLPQLKALCRVPREFIFCFDQDTKWQTRIDITQAIKRTGKALEELDSDVSVMVWDPVLDGEGKGIDDFVLKNPGMDKLYEIYDARLTLEKYLEKHEKVKRLGRDGFLRFLKTAYKGRLAYNQLTERPELDGEPLELSGELCFKLIEDHMIDVSEDVAIYGFKYVAKSNPYHPVAKYLESCKDLEPVCIDDLANRYLGIDPNNVNSNLYNIFVRKWLLAAVARIFEPGCDVHHALILQAQTHGIGKSTFFKTLGGKWHDSSATSDTESHKNKMVFHKCWIQEWDEFEKITNARAAGEVKSFITNSVDNYVKAYGRDALDHPRRFVIAGTVNSMEFLIDETGNRRFLVVPIPAGWRIPNDILSSERDRLWGSILQLYLECRQKGVRPWVLTSQEEKVTTEVNQQFMVPDEWLHEMERYLKGKEKITVMEIMEKLFTLDSKDQTTAIQKRIRKNLRIMGWSQSQNQEKDPDTGKRDRYWYPPVL